MKSTIYLFALFTAIFACTADKKTLWSWDYRLFNDSPAWKLAKAVRDSDTKEIKEIVTSGVDVDFTEGRFGQTLLMVAVQNHNYASCKALLEAGANPGKHDSYSGTSAMILSADIQTNTWMDTAFLNLMIRYGGDPNDEEVGKRVGGSVRETPLLQACRDPLTDFAIHKVRILVNHGADINHRNEFIRTPLGAAMVSDQMEVVSFLRLLVLYFQKLDGSTITCYMKEFWILSGSQKWCVFHNFFRLMTIANLNEKLMTKLNQEQVQYMYKRTRVMMQG